MSYSPHFGRNNGYVTTHGAKASTGPPFEGSFALGGGLALLQPIPDLFALGAGWGGFSIS